MPEPKFFVWARGRWRELCLSSGRVHGAGGPVRFLYVRGARLQAARAPRVLRALRALAAGQPAAARDGAPLPQRRRVRRPHRSHSCRRHHCCAAHTQCTTSFSEAPKPRVGSPPPPQPPQPPPRADAATQATDPAPPARDQTTQPTLLTQSPKASTAQVPPRPRAKRKRSRTPRKRSRTPRKRERSDTSADGLSVAAFKRREFCKELLINENDADLYRSYLMENDPEFDLYRKRSRTPRKRSRTPRKRERSDTSADGLSVAAFKRREFCKELLINENDADLYRSYLMENDPEFDLYRFDTDDSYKMQFFYRINPLVTLVPCRQLEAMLLRRASQDTISLKDFATKLGLRSISDQEESENNKRYKMRRRTKALASSTTTSDGDTDKENLAQNRRKEAPASHKKKDAIGENRNKEVTNNKRNDSPVGRESRKRDTSVEDKHKTDDPPVDRTLRKRLMVAAVQRNIGNLDKSEENKEVTNNKRKDSPVVRENTKRDTPGADKQKADGPPVERLRRRLMVPAVQSSDDRNIGNLDKSVENSSVGKNDKKNGDNSRSNKSDRKSVENNSRNKSDGKSVEDNNLPKSHKKVVEKSSTSKDNAKSLNNKKVDTIVVSASTSSSDSGRQFSGTKPRFFTRKKLAVPKPSAVKLMSQTSKRSSMTSIGKKCGGGREYLPLEDHAIVAFVSSGDRARRVNGNLLWRELQEQYHRLTGQSRSWHSLRNRYLRYILPALGQLALAPALVARLRANAAKGEIKSRKRPSAPNPLCVAPRVRSAFAARPPSRSIPSPSPTPSPTRQPPPLPAGEERPLRARRRENTVTPSPAPASASAPPRRSLRSSGVAPPAPPASPPARSPSQPPTASVRPRMRKLFNPNAHTMR